MLRQGKNVVFIGVVGVAWSTISNVNSGKTKILKYKIPKHQNYKSIMMEK